MFEAGLFYFFALVTVVAGVSVITQRNPINSAISLVASFFGLAAIYAMMGAHFVAVIQLLVYAGAIMVLFIFVIMVLNVRDEGGIELFKIGRRGILGVSVGLLLGGGVLIAAGAVGGAELLAPGRAPADFGSIEAIGTALFDGRYLLPFEVISILLTVAVVGAVVLAKREL